MNVILTKDRVIWVMSNMYYFVMFYSPTVHVIIKSVVCIVCGPMTQLTPPGDTEINKYRCMSAQISYMKVKKTNLNQTLNII